MLWSYLHRYSNNVRSITTDTWTNIYSHIRIYIYIYRQNPKLFKAIDCNMFRICHSLSQKLASIGSAIRKRKLNKYYRNDTQLSTSCNCANSFFEVNCNNNMLIEVTYKISVTLNGRTSEFIGNTDNPYKNISLRLKTLI